MAATETFANNPSTTVTAGGTTAPAGGTTETWTVASPALFPAAATGVTQFHVADPVLPSELIAVTNVAGGTWTVTRGAESTTPVAHAGGFTVYQVVSPGFFTGLQLNRVDWLNVVTGYNADPSGSADSTTAIQNALTAASSSGGVVYFPAGTYKISSALTVSAFTTLLGDGDNVSVIHQVTTTANGLIATDPSFVTIRGLRVTGPGSGSGVGISFGLSVHTNMECLAFEDITVTAFGSHGIALVTPIVSRFARVTASLNGGDGWHLTSSTTCTSCSWVACYADTNTGYGYNLSKVGYSALTGCACDHNTNGYLLSQCQAVTLAGCGAESQTTDAFIISGGSGNTLAGCRVFANGHYGIHVASGETQCSLIGCMENSPGGGAVNFIITDANTSATIINQQNTTANSLAGNVSQITGGSAGFGVAQDGTTGDILATGTLKLTTGASINFGGALDTDLYRLATNSLATDGLFTAFGGLQASSSLDITAVGSGLKVAEGTNAKQGITAAMTAGTITVANTSVTANSRIFLTAQNTGGTAGALRVSARTAGTSFTITSSSATDTSTVAYQIFEPG